MFFKKTVDALRRKELQEAEMDLVGHRTHLDYHAAMVSMREKQVARLTAEILQNTTSVRIGKMDSKALAEAMRTGAIAEFRLSSEAPPIQWPESGPAVGPQTTDAAAAMSRFGSVLRGEEVPTRV